MSCTGRAVDGCTIGWEGFWAADFAFLLVRFPGSVAARFPLALTGMNCLRSVKGGLKGVKMTQYTHKFILRALRGILLSSP